MSLDENKRLTLDSILKLFNKNDEIWNDLMNLNISDTWINIYNGTIANEKYKYNQSYTLVVDRGDIYITNWRYLGEEKFYQFQDKYSYKKLKSAIKNFIKLQKKEEK